ncbi:hypothetical protein TeGR_g3732 [Tetraparma gracilis]|uniref:Uncharacterized protein n=1 Tax=Tetraparma gracilis TaxID=2962635 RepID=A0ABQ6MJH7_9STRA|nr:hypothetical protein TeGR_g3732 [Tetraparma gracilis]
MIVANRGKEESFGGGYAGYEGQYGDEFARNEAQEIDVSPMDVHTELFFYHVLRLFTRLGVGATWDKRGDPDSPKTMMLAASKFGIFVL